MKEGDKVQLITGCGPIMVISEVLTTIKHIGKGNIRCTWWVEDEKNFKEYYFMEKELTPYKEGPRAIVT